MTFVILTGASGSGKTTIAREFSNRYSSIAEVCFFDSIGVPTPDEMVRKFGSGEQWQRAKTMDWLREIRSRLVTKPVLFEGQMRLAFVEEAAKAARILSYRIILVDCDDATRRQRLVIERRQEHLASEEMLNWARFLREEAKASCALILNTSEISVGHAVELVRRHF